MCIQIQPTSKELVTRAIVDTDFLGETPRGTSQREIYRAATIATNQAAEAWEDAMGQPIGLTVPDSIRHSVALSLVQLAHDRHGDSRDAEFYALREGMLSGDLDKDGFPRPYPLCVSAA